MLETLGSTVGKREREGVIKGGGARREGVCSSVCTTTRSDDETATGESAMVGVVAIGEERAPGVFDRVGSAGRGGGGRKDLACIVAKFESSERSESSTLAISIAGASCSAVSVVPSVVVVCATSIIGLNVVVVVSAMQGVLVSACSVVVKGMAESVVTTFAVKTMFGAVIVAILVVAITDEKEIEDTKEGETTD